MSNSLRKLSGAAARLNGRGVATEADVDEAFHMLTLKLEIVRWLAGDTETIRPLLPREDALARAAQERELRQTELRATYGGQKVHSARMAQETGIKEKVIRRECWGMGMKPVDGLWPMPTEEQYERQIEQREEVAALARAEAVARGEEPELAVDDHDAQVAELLRTLDDSAFAWEDPLPGLPKLMFRDGIPKMPVETRPFMKAMTHVPTHKQEDLGQALADIVLHEVPPNPHERRMYIEEMYQFVPSELGPACAMAQRLQPQVSALLCHPDWVTRGRWALAMLWESTLSDDPMTMPYMKFQLERVQRQGKAPPDELVQGIFELARRFQLRERAEAAAAERGLAL